MRIISASVLMLLTDKLSKLVHVCQTYSLPKLARFLRHSASRKLSRTTRCFVSFLSQLYKYKYKLLLPPSHQHEVQAKILRHRDVLLFVCLFVCLFVPSLKCVLLLARLLALQCCYASRTTAVPDVFSP